MKRIAGEEIPDSETHPCAPKGGSAAAKERQREGRRGSNENSVPYNGILYLPRETDSQFVNEICFFAHLSFFTCPEAENALARDQLFSLCAPLSLFRFASPAHTHTHFVGAQSILGINNLPTRLFLIESVSIVFLLHLCRSSERAAALRREETARTPRRREYRSREEREGEKSALSSRERN